MTKIGNEFLSHCTSLESIDLTPLKNVKTIGSNFLNNCPKLTNATLYRSMEGGIVHRKLIDFNPNVTINWIDE